MDANEQLEIYACNLWRPSVYRPELADTLWLHLLASPARLACTAAVARVLGVSRSAAHEQLRAMARQGEVWPQMWRGQRIEAFLPGHKAPADVRAAWAAVPPAPSCLFVEGWGVSGEALVRLGFRLTRAPGGALTWTHR